MPAFRRCHGPTTLGIIAAMFFVLGTPLSTSAPAPRIYLACVFAWFLGFVPRLAADLLL